MNKMNFKTLIPVFFLFFSTLNGFGQEVLSKERADEIKTSGKYYYSVCSAFDEATAKECALFELKDEAYTGLVKQSVRIDAAELTNAIEARAKIAPLSLSGSTTMMAWIEKESVLPGYTPPTPKPEQTQTLSTVSVTQQTQTTTSPGPTPDPPKPDIPASNVTAVDNPIVRELATCKTFAQLRTVANKHGLVYGTNKSSFFYPDKCLVAVFTTEQQLIALLDVGQGARKDLLTGNSIQNFEQQFSGNILYWININEK